MFLTFPPIRIPVIGMEQVRLPQMYRIRQEYPRQKISSLRKELEEQLERFVENAPSLHGKRIAVTAGSRGIHGVAELLSTLCRWLENQGAQPFLVPAMGSHGGATAQGQLEVLANLGITPESIGVPILSSMEVVCYGEVDGTPLYCDRNAFEADGIVVFNKVKPHTDFRGEVESGLCKMIAIGLGKHTGASVIHDRGYADFARILSLVAETFLNTGKCVLGLGVCQNAYDEVCALRVCQPADLISTDKELLKIASERMARLKTHCLDVLVLDEIGKNIGGFGYDPNVVGRSNSGLPGFDHILQLQRLCILGLTEQTHHNGCGIGAADITTARCLNDIDWDLVWTNLATSQMIQGGKIPMYANSDFEAIRMAIRTCGCTDPEKVRLLRARNTASLFEVEVSQALYDELKDRSDITVIEGPYELSFDPGGNLTDARYHK